MIAPLPFYEHIATLNGQILEALEEPTLDHALGLLQERYVWMRLDNTPSVESEAAVRPALVPVLEAILRQDELIGAGLLARQAGMAADLQAAHRARIALGYSVGEGTPDARFVDRSG
ncbi:MAG: hypothetical protein ABI743_00845 [bacterium]